MDINKIRKHAKRGRIQRASKFVTKKSNILDVADCPSLKLRKVGKEYKGICPYCRGKYRTLSISPDAHVFSCKTCGKMGDTADLYYMVKYGMENVDADLKSKPDGMHTESDNSGSHVIRDTKTKSKENKIANRNKKADRNNSANTKLLKRWKSQMDSNDHGITISPSFDFAHGVAFCFIPKYKKAAENNMSKDRIYQVVSSNREVFECTIQELERRGIALRSDPTYPQRRWHEKDIRNFLLNRKNVKPGKTFDIIKHIYDSYIDYGVNYGPEIFALYTIGCYIHRIFESYPYIYLAGEINSGKSKTMKIANKLCFNAQLMSNITPSSLFRIVDGSSCTCLLDEEDRLRSRYTGDAIIALLNNGYYKGTLVPRMIGKKIEYFDLFSPKMIANTRGLSRDLESRCIKFVMAKSLDPEKANSTVSESSQNWGKIRHQLYCFGLTHFKDIRQIYQMLIISNKSDLSARHGELWFPILSIAKFLEDKGCKGLCERVVNAANTIDKDTLSNAIDDWTERLIYAVAYIVLIDEREEGIFIHTIMERMDEYMSPLSTYAKPPAQPTAHWIGRKLRNLRLTKKSTRVTEGYKYDIPAKNVMEVLQRTGLIENFRQMHNVGLFI